MRILSFALLTAGLTASTACGSGPGSIKGSVAGKSVAVKSAAFSNVPAPASIAELGISTVSIVVLSDSANACNDVTAGKLQPNSSYFMIGMGSLTSSSPSATTYTAVSTSSGGSTTATAALLSGDVAFAALQVDDSTCTNQLTTSQSIAQSGTITLNSISSKSGGNASGSFSLQVGSQLDGISGTFDASYCPGVSAFVSTNASFFTDSFSSSTTATTPTPAPCQ